MTQIPSLTSEKRICFATYYLFADAWIGVPVTKFRIVPIVLVIVHIICIRIRLCRFLCLLLFLDFLEYEESAAPSNISPASEEYAQLVAERVEKLRAADPDMDETAVPVDLVTCSGSGLDPHISPAAAEYQVARIAKANDMTEDEVREIIQNCTDGRFLGIFGEETVNVLEVNLMLDGILEG